MKNKGAERAKKKSRALKEAERRKEQENLLKKFNEIAKKHGVNNVKYNKQTLWQTFMKVDKEMVKLSIVYSVMAVAYCLRKTFGWGKIKIYRYAVDMNRYITSVGKQDRDIPALNEELRTEAGIDCTKIFEDYKPYMLKKVSLQKSSEAEAMFEKIKYILPMVIYPLYSREGWKQKRMNRLGQALKKTLIDILESDEIDNIKRTMYEECGLKFYDDGTVDPN